MKKYLFKKIDAFATAESGGNPAGTVWLESLNGISHAEMLQIARELKGFVSEVGYIHKIEDGKYGVKYYSSEREVNFCGHATIAMMYELFASGEVPGNRKQIKIVTNDGELNVENRIKSDQAVFIMSPGPKELTVKPGIDEIAAGMNISPGIIDRQLPVQIINAGLSTLILPIKTLEEIVGITPDINTLKKFCLDNGIDIVEVFTGEVADSNNDFRVRVFAATFGYLEDPATGSGNSAFGYYLVRNKMWKRETTIIEQNSDIKNYNIVKLQRVKDESGSDRIIFGGGAVKRIEGEYILYTE